MMKNSIFKKLASTALFSAIAISPNAAFANGDTQISNTATGESINSFGLYASPTYGQVFTAPVTGKLTSFQLSLDGGVGSLFGGVGTWNGGATYGAGYGSPTNLYLSAPVASAGAGTYNFYPDVSVAAGKQYVAYLTTYGNSSANDYTSMPVGTSSSNINYFVWNNNGNPLGKTQWDYFGNSVDWFPGSGGALFSATFSGATVGAPEIDGGKLPLALMLLGLLFVITKRTRQGRLVAG